MSENIPSSTFQCTQCGGELHPDEGQQFLICPYCNSTVYLDKSKVVFHWYVAPTFDQSEAQGALARWMAGNDTVKDLDKKSQIVETAFEYFPLWYFKQKDQHGKETILLEPAAATAITEITQLKLPAGDLRKYEDRLDTDAHAPTVPLDAALNWAAEGRAGFKEQVAESALVHVPIYIFKYAFKGRTFTALVDAASGAVLANIYPEKAEMPYQLVGGAAAVTFLCLATFPVIGSVAGDGGGITGFVLCTALGIPAGGILMALAAWVSQKV